MYFFGVLDFLMSKTLVDENNLAWAIVFKGLKAHRLSSSKKPIIASLRFMVTITSVQ